MALTLSTALTLTACGANSDTTESSKDGKNVTTGKRGAESDSLGVADGGESSTVCDAGAIVPILPESENDRINPKLPDDEIIPKLPECAKDDTVTTRGSDDHGCLEDAICVYKDPDFSGPVATLDLVRARSTFWIRFSDTGGFTTTSYSLFSDGTPINNEISSIVNNSDMDTKFWVDAEPSGGKIEVKSHSENSNLSEWGVNDVISSMDAESN
ncbi:peptidase inhibitor family I36 protein [Streptomyces tauricus]|uniref:peptidase inhibitor family I36 protein n=1 Tax=Streptomyces tauricus TaxID=68274 RepID=UPI002244E48F|nr:peptidase inhibitor family I36 protein [Streptomyces tauricus]MCW8103434.1 peptidase inhibitor family I36 protein [Streptomyces tauricus]